MNNMGSEKKKKKGLNIFKRRMLFLSLALLNFRLHWLFAGELVLGYHVAINSLRHFLATQKGPQVQNS